MTAPRLYVEGMSVGAAMTAEELLRLNLPNKRTELVRGVLVVREPAGFAHGRVAMRIALKLGAHVEQTRAGELLAAETGFTLARGPDTVRAPDVAFVSRERVPEPFPRGFPELAPDLAVEVLSPDDRPGEVLAKVADWLNAGCRLVWVVDPARRGARVYRADGTESQLTDTDQFDGEDVLPGLSFRLSDVL